MQWVRMLKLTVSYVYVNFAAITLKNHKCSCLGSTDGVAPIIASYLRATLLII